MKWKGRVLAQDGSVTVAGSGCAAIPVVFILPLVNNKPIHLFALLLKAVQADACLQ